MSDTQISFVSLFVPDPASAAAALARVLGVRPRRRTAQAPASHPFARSRAYVVAVGDVEILFFATDNATTHAGDVGLGLRTGEGIASLLARVTAAGGQVLLDAQAGRPANGAQRSLKRIEAVFALPGPHFFELQQGHSGSEHQRTARTRNRVRVGARERVRARRAAAVAKL